MWHVMETTQRSHDLSDRLIRAISGWTLSMPTVIGRFGQDEDGLEDVERLLDSGADVNRLHGTLLPLHCACMVGDTEVLELLLSRDARVNSVDGYGRTALHYAAERCPQCVSLLLAHGADVDSTDGNRNTPLHWSVYRDSVECASVLLATGSNVNALDANRETPLTWAARKGNLSSVRLLLDYNATTEIRDVNGLTALDHVIHRLAGQRERNRDHSILDLLVDLSACSLDQIYTDYLSVGDPLFDRLAARCTGAATLKQLSRRAIRCSIASPNNLASVVQSLPLPILLQKYVRLMQT